MVELTSLWLPIVLSSVALFFIGFITWMILPLHKADWNELPDERGFGEAVRGSSVPAGNYMFPFAADTEAMKSEAFLQKQEQGPNGIMQVWGGPCNMGATLGLQFAFLLATNACLAYLATLGVNSGADFMTVFRFMGTAAMLVLIVGHVPGRIWYKTRLTGHLIDGVVMGLVVGVIFALLWPEAAVVAG